jgi:pimeloyl-ACP methyl ester carboxylesterase
MAGIPETRYAKDGDSHHIAYQVVGEGQDLLFVPAATFPIDLLWDEPAVAGHLRRLASFSRLILTDLLGTGSSDAVPIHDRPAMQAWTDGLVAVLDAVGSECVSVFAMSESGITTISAAARRADGSTGPGHIAQGCSASLRDCAASSERRLAR